MHQSRHVNVGLSNQHLHGGDEDAEDLGEQGDGRMEFDFYETFMSDWALMVAENPRFEVHFHIKGDGTLWRYGGRAKLKGDYNKL